MLAQILQPLNERSEFRRTPIYTFKQYVGDVFLPAYRQKWKESTRSTSEPDILRYLVPAFGDQLMSMITRQHMQKFLDGERSIVERCRASSLAPQCHLQDGR
jgi:hypothetical protein